MTDREFAILLVALIVASPAIYFIIESILFSVALVYDYKYTVKEAKEIDIYWDDLDFDYNIVLFLSTRIVIPIIYALRKIVRGWF